MKKFLCKVFGCKFKSWQGYAGVWHLERFPRCLRCGARNPDFVIAKDEGDDWPRRDTPKSGDWQ